MALPRGWVVSRGPGSSSLSGPTTLGEENKVIIWTAVLHGPAGPEELEFETEHPYVYARRPEVQDEAMSIAEDLVRKRYGENTVIVELDWR